ncbi:hypothetical protein Misp01_62800 [Microtetraspora sp. NBRC 13810]|uniref:hypothetical protein n=1 Tax=Microtetraspora sp. NBRC 13810 TaxID=3030990 RepID=UPI0024A352EF|nr:hypothetical protein [Microtetraspora sp. NBRC 13810]GLW11152.1 hypothetical protein Misp01_62800 [Microtetraspora sp. NBRC 13810]
MNPGEREELARLLPYRADPELPRDRHRTLKEFVMTEIHRDPRPAAPRRRFPRLALLAPALAAAGLAVAAPMLLGGAEPAYAVTKEDDGTIFVTINEAKDPDGLEAELRALGLNAVVDYVPMGKKCSPQPRSERFLTKEEAPLTVFPAPKGQETGFTLDPGVVKAGQTAVLEFSVSEQTGGVIAAIWARVSDGPVAECHLADSTEAPLGPPAGS